MAKRSPAPIRWRLILVGIITLPLLLFMMASSIDRAHQDSLLESEHESLKLAFGTLLGAIEYRDGELLVGERLREPRFFQIRSGLYAGVSSEDSEILWKSLSSVGSGLADSLYTDWDVDTGEEQIDDITFENSRFFRLRFSLSWEDEFGRQTPLLMTILAADTELVARRDAFRRTLLTWISTAGVVFILLQALALRWGLRPLRTLSREIRLLESGQQEKMEANYPVELSSATNNLNKLLQREQQQRQRYRNTLGDLAHSLKTPLSVLGGALEEEPTDIELCRQQTKRMQELIDWQLKRAVVSSGKTLGKRIEIEPVVQRLIDTLGKVYRDKDVKAESTLAKGSYFFGDEQDLMELLGNLLDNAYKACTSKVRVSSVRTKANLRLIVEDDGSGWSEPLLEKLTQRGKRGDEYGAGQGLGLAIVRELVDSLDATLIMDNDTELGGARVEVRLD